MVGGVRISPRQPVAADEPTTYPSQAALQSAVPAGDNSGEVRRVATGTANQPRLFVSNGSAWVPSVTAVWRTSDTGLAAFDSLTAAAGAAAFTADIGVTGNNRELFCIVHDDADGDAGRKVFWVDAQPFDGVVLGVTHGVDSIVCSWLDEDPQNHDDFTTTDGGAGAVSDYDTTVPGRTYLKAGTGTTSVVSDATAPDDPTLLLTLAVAVDIIAEDTSPSVYVGARYDDTVAGDAKRVVLRAGGNGSAGTWGYLTSPANNTGITDIGTEMTLEHWHRPSDGQTSLFRDYGDAVVDSDTPNYATTTSDPAAFVLQAFNQSTDGEVSIRGALVATFSVIP